ncbi:unnamed protein product [Dovyalis caffra]|uniref:Uncharacterized protein n=1 Tax=Dovyalis caffra TaxID=77055 RepID=A0AAV1S3Q4_9ROSI|nr:unnamed protein product [Dovyalis caffra]
MINMRESEFFQLSSPQCDPNNIQASLDGYRYFELAMDANEHHFDEFSPPVTTNDAISNELADHFPEDSVHPVPSWRRFEETKRRLQDCANSFGLMLEVEEVELQNLMSEINEKIEGGERREWLAFNCMWAFPHMGRKRSRRHVLDFVRTAKEILANISVYSNTSSGGGILTFGDGGGWELSKDCPGFGLFFDNSMEHYHALLESIEWNFPICFLEARIAVECLFVAPYVSSRAWIQNWEEIEQGCDFKTGLGLEGLRLGNESLREAKELVREGETPYAARIEGENYNEMVLESRGTPLIKFSSWK